MDEIYKTGIIPDAICEAFGMPLNTTLDDVFEQVGGAVNLSKKGIQHLI